MLYYINKTYYLEVGVIKNNGDFASGLTVTYSVYKSSDESLIQSGTLTEIGVSGVYKTSIQFTQAGQYRIEYVTPVSYENRVDVWIVEDDLHELVRRVLGLTQENFRIWNPVYDINKNLTSATIKIYPTAGDLEADTNEIATYSLIATYNINKTIKTYKFKKV